MGWCRRWAMATRSLGRRSAWPLSTRRRKGSRGRRWRGLRPRRAPPARPAGPRCCASACTPMHRHAALAAALSAPLSGPASSAGGGSRRDAQLARRRDRRAHPEDIHGGEQALQQARLRTCARAQRSAEALIPTPASWRAVCFVCVFFRVCRDRDIALKCRTEWPRRATRHHYFYRLSFARGDLRSTHAGTRGQSVSRRRRRRRRNGTTA